MRVTKNSLFSHPQSVFNLPTALYAQESAVASCPVAPAYYGPNAFPIPEMGFGRTCSELNLEAGAALALHKGFSIREDATVDAYFKLRIPLFTP